MPHAVRCPPCSGHPVPCGRTSSLQWVLQKCNGHAACMSGVPGLKEFTYTAKNAAGACALPWAASGVPHRVPRGVPLHFCSGPTHLAPAAGSVPVTGCPGLLHCTPPLQVCKPPTQLLPSPGLCPQYLPCWTVHFLPGHVSFSAYLFSGCSFDFKADYSSSSTMVHSANLRLYQRPRAAGAESRHAHNGPGRRLVSTAVTGGPKPRWLLAAGSFWGVGGAEPRVGAGLLCCHLGTPATAPS